MDRHTTDIEEMTLSDSVILRQSFEKLDREHGFSRFDYYMIERWSGETCGNSYDDIEPEEVEKLRKKAYNNFNKAVKGCNVGNYRTIKKWFGIGEFVPPKREMIFKIALALELSVEEARDYLVNGMTMPDFQINDYQEMIFLYGIHNNISYDYCHKMIELFEEKMGFGVSYEQGSHTDELWKEYELRKNVKPEIFLKWMLENRELFKGYSKTVLEYFVLLKKEIAQYIKKDAREYLEELLAGSEYEKWKKNYQKKKGENSDDEIYAYIRYMARYSNGKIDKNAIDSMRKAYAAAYGEDSNSEIIREIYTIYTDDGKKEEYSEKISVIKNSGISFMTDKYLSQIINIAEQKSVLMRLRNIRARLNNMSEDVECPAAIYSFIIEHGKKPKNNTVNECRKVIAYYMKNQNQRCQLIGREDILPLIHYITQKRYASLLKEEKRYYNMEEAREFFIRMADTTLLKCGMAPISPKYKGDYLMLSSFSKEDMYSLNDMLEISVQI